MAETLQLSAGLGTATVDLVQDLLEQLWETEPQVADVDRIRLGTAVAEIVGNIVEHTQRLDPPGSDSRRMQVVVWCTADEVGAEFVDNGLPVAIDLSEVTMPDPEAESGRGLALTLAAVDDLDYERTNGRNHWRLVCRRSA